MPAAPVTCLAGSGPASLGPAGSGPTGQLGFEQARLRRAAAAPKGPPPPWMLACLAPGPRPARAVRPKAQVRRGGRSWPQGSQELGDLAAIWGSDDDKFGMAVGFKSSAPATPGRRRAA